MRIAKNTAGCRKQHKDTIIQCGNNVEHEICTNGQSVLRMIETDGINTHKPSQGMLERILSRDNMNEAYLKVKKNNGEVELTRRRWMNFQNI